MPNHANSKTESAPMGVGLSAALASLAALLVAAIGLLVNVDIVSRVALDTPLRGVSELVTVCMPITVFLALGWCQQSTGLIRSGLLSRWFDAKTSTIGAVAEWVFAAIACLVCAAITSATWPWLLRAWQNDEFIGVAGEFTIATWPAMAAIILGTALLGCFSVVDLLKTTRRVFRVRPMLITAPLATLAVLPLALALCDSRAAIGGVAIALMFILLYSGLPVAYSLMTTAALGIGFITGSPMTAVNSLGLAAGGAVSSYVFGAVPMFILMGLVMGRADIGRDSLLAAHWLLRRVAGALGIATVVANAIFAAITGISIASAAIFSKIAVPPLIEQGFTPRFAVGLVAGSSVLGMLIPPSLLLIIYGIVAEVSINALFMAAIVPGLMLTGLFIALVITVALTKAPFAIQALKSTAPLAGLSLQQAGMKLFPLALLVIAVLGGIYGGLFTPTEAGAVGSLLAIIVALVMRRLRPTQLGGIVFESATTSASILFLIVAASAFGMMLTISGIPATVGAMVAEAGLGLNGYVMIYLVLLVALGMVLDSTSIMLIMVPLALPTVKVLGGDPVWFGIITVIGVEIGLLTPPLGLSVFAIKSSLDDQRISLNDIFIGAVPFTLLMAALLVSLIAAPWLTQVIG